MYSAALLALAAVASASTWSGQPIPNCGWTTTLIYEADHTDTVPIPLASADCSGSMTTMVSPPAPVTTPAYTSPLMTTTTPAYTSPMMTTPVVSPPASPSMVMQCTEYSDGQPQCSMAPAPACTEYSDGQPQCPTSAMTVMPPPPPMSPTGYYPTGGYGTGSYAQPTGTGAVYSSATSVAPAIGAAPTQGPVFGLIAAAGFAVAML